MFTRNIDQLFDEMRREMMPIEAAGTTRLAEGRRIENVDGEITEYRLNEDGEWTEVGDSDDSYTLSDEGLTMELSGKVETDGISGAVATLNNGILSVDFIRDEE